MTLDNNLSGKGVLITGVSRRKGIGAATAGAFADAGANVFTSYYRPFDRFAYGDTDPNEAEEIIGELRSICARAGGCEADLGDPETPRRLFEQAEEAIGPVDILVNNAAYDELATIYTLTAAILDTHYNVNIRGTTLMCQEFAARHDGTRSGGRIISISGGQSIGSEVDNLPYDMTKAVVDLLTRNLSLALLKKGITVNAVDPGATATGWIDDATHAALARNTLYGHVGMPADAVRLILFLASSQGAWITGQIIHSRGGL